MKTLLTAFLSLISLAATPSQALTISQFSLQEVVLTDAWIGWTTDEAALSQVHFEGGGQSETTPSDLIFRTSHSIHLSGLLPDTEYIAYAISTDASGNVAYSQRVIFGMPNWPGQVTYLDPIPTPEPSAYATLATGCALLALIAARRLSATRSFASA